MNDLKGKFIDPLGRNKSRGRDLFEIKEYEDKTEYILTGKNIPSDSKGIFGSDQKYHITVKGNKIQSMGQNITVSGTNTKTNEYFECGYINGKYKVIAGTPPKNLKIAFDAENYFIITEKLKLDTKKQKGV